MEGATVSREMRVVARASQHLPPKTLKRETRFWAGGTGVITLWSILAALCTPPVIFFVTVVSFGLYRFRNRTLLPPCSAGIWYRDVFEVTLARGSFTYLQAKYLDAAWNLLVGKTSQAVAAWICYKIFAMALLRITERSKVSFTLYTAVAFYPTDFLTLWKYLRGLEVGHTARERAILIWFCFATAYVLTLSTILDLVTGYVTTQEPAVKLIDGSFAPFGQLQWLDSTNQMVADGYASGYSFNNLLHDRIIISVHTPSGQNFTYFDLIDSSTSSWKNPPIVCVPSTRYRWGFSLGWMYVLLISTTIWMWGMFGMYVDAKKHDFLWQMGRRPGVYRDILDVAEAIQEELGPDTCGYSDKELSREVEQLDPVGFVGMQTEGNVHDIRLSTRVCDAYDSLRDEDMSCEREYGNDSMLTVEEE